MRRSMNYILPMLLLLFISAAVNATPNRFSSFTMPTDGLRTPEVRKPLPVTTYYYVVRIMIKLPSPMELPSEGTAIQLESGGVSYWDTFKPFYQDEMETLPQQTDPNAWLNIDPMELMIMCMGARKMFKNVYESKYANIFTPYEQQILKYAGYREPAVIALIETDPNAPFEIIRKAWDEKWSKVYCPRDSTNTYGRIDVLLLRSNQFQTIHNLYDNQWRIKANINRVVGLTKYNDYSKAADNPNTLSDIIEKMLDEKWGQLASSQSLVEAIQRSYEKLKRYGALKFEQLSPEEQARQLELSKQIPQKKTEQ